MASLIAVHPVLNVRDVMRSVDWYRQLGFTPAFADDDASPRYAGIGRDGVEVHLQWHAEEEWAAGLDGSAYRFLVDDPDAIHAEISGRCDLLDDRVVADTSWGTREFGLYDPDGNALFFYRDR